MIHTETHVSPEWWIVLLIRFLPVPTANPPWTQHWFMERSTRIASWSTSFCFLKKIGNVKGLSELTSYAVLLKWHYEHPWIHDYFGAEMIDTYWHHLAPGSCALWFAFSSFVFPCSPQMRCNFRTAQLGTSFAGYCPFTETCTGT